MAQELIEALKNKERQEQLSTVKMANRLGITPSYLYMIYKGQRQPGLKLLGAIITVFPDLVSTVSLFLRTLVSNTQDVSSDSQCQPPT